MSRVVYVDGRYVPYAAAAVHVEDRGFQFADAVYEVIEVWNGALVDESAHLDRLACSLAEIKIRMPMSSSALRQIIERTKTRNRVRDGLVYLQVTRGAGRRDFFFPPPGSSKPTVVCIARNVPRPGFDQLAERGVGVKTVPDIRWARCDIKSVMLLPACLAKEAARQEGAREAWFVDAGGYVTEGASSNAWIVAADGQLVTRRLGHEILPGITRATVFAAIAGESLSIVERPFSVAEAKAAREAFNTSATGTVMPVVSVDGSPVGSGLPGPISRMLRAKFHQVAEISTAQRPRLERILT